ncbi:MerR family transcriptional regulator [Feifania hominis]|uniref:MerR family transcriptional regulator n=1 Tax=Feifania hominis TaxID=2763660 RepID=A0A926HPL4_9FIRM|nr:MerR family transcriptional regulator [Feifania hominis]MBC8535397.1 MerR family transcriptional regulator [Feifania hominis]
MKKFFTVGEAAKLAGTTCETLRHYDRIGLVCPHKKDPWTGYRYYSEAELVRLNAVQALQLMDLSLREIREVLEYENLEGVLSLLERADKSADDKIRRLKQAKAKIRRAQMSYKNNLQGFVQTDIPFTRQLPQRVILLSNTLSEPRLELLTDYLRHFYEQIGDAHRSTYSFEDLAGIYTRDGNSRLFAVCTRYPPAQDLTVLPGGLYLCSNCTQENRQTALEQLVRTAREQYAVNPAFTVQIVVVTGILNWSYQIQIPLECDSDPLPSAAEKDPA